MAGELTQPETVANESADRYQKEVEEALDKDNQQLGDVWRLHQEGRSPKEIGEELGIGGPYNHLRCFEALVKGQVPDAPSVARGCASALRGFSRRHGKTFLSPETVKEIRKRAEKCDSNGGDPDLLEEEKAKLEQQTHTIEDKKMGPGIYVYTLPHYLQYPVEKAPKKGGAEDRTYLKVGSSKTDASVRAIIGGRTTGIPESPLLLRVYAAPAWREQEVVDSSGADNRKSKKKAIDKEIEDNETKIHKHLQAADHIRNSAPGVGTEWFLTHLKFLDSIADLLGLQHRHRFEDSDNES